VLSNCGGPPAAGAGPANVASRAHTPEARPGATHGSGANSSAASTPPQGTEEAAGPAWLGVELATRDPGEPGVLVRGVLRGSPAAGGGVEPGDVIVSVDGENVLQPSDVQRLIRERSPAARVSLALLRAGAPRILAIQLERLPDQDEVLRKNFVGLSAPDFGSLKSVQGSVTPELSALKGRVVIVEFWATWCNVCRFMTETLNHWHERYDAQGLTVIGVTAEPVVVASQGAFSFGISYAVASDDSGEMTRTYRALALPTLFVIDRRGTIRDVMVGYSSERLIEIDRLLKRLVVES
jgi:peroxiredoxin